MVSKRLSSSAQIKWTVAIEGRLAHVRILFQHRHLDVLAGYQATDQRTQASQASKQRFWNRLDELLTKFPKRNHLIVAGDWNCSLPAIPGQIGTNQFQWQGRQHSGYQHQDMGQFSQIIKQSGLIALNSWDSSLGPTYRRTNAASRIDHAFVRATHADHWSKQVRYLWDAPIMYDSTVGHVPILVHIPKNWTPYRRPLDQVSCGYRQRLQCRKSWSQQDDTWEGFSNATLACIHEHFHTQYTDPAHFVSLHQPLATMFHQHYPANHTNKEVWTSGQPLVESKWDHFRALKQTKDTCLPSLFWAWKHWMQFRRLDRSHAKHANLVRKQRIEDMLLDVQHASDRHEYFHMFKTINQYMPRTVRRKIRIHNSQVVLATPVEELAILKGYVADLWKGPLTVLQANGQPPGVPFSERELRDALTRIPINKSTATPFTPGIIWKHHADIISTYLYPRLESWWGSYPPLVPEEWKHGYLTWLPKPRKQATKPAWLRPISFLEPVGKAIVGLLAKKAQAQAWSQLCQWPQWGYLPHRNALDAIRRAAVHCPRVRSMMHHNRRTVQRRATQPNTPTIYGGIQNVCGLGKGF